MERKTLVAVSAILAFLVIFSAFAGGMFLGRILEQNNAAELSRNLPSVEKVSNVLSIIDHEYVDQVSDKKLINGAVKGMVDALGDPFTHYLDATHFTAFSEETSGYFDGVGILVSMNKDKQLVVVSPMEGTPAEKAGVKANDIIVKIDGKSIQGVPEEQAIKKIRGKRGTKVKLTVTREGVKKPIDFTLTREQISIPNMKEKMLSDKKTGYILIRQFNSQTSADLKKKIDKLSSQGMQGLILDLRQNPGGILDEAVNVGSLWIENGPIVKIKSRTGDIESDNANGGADTKIPLVVLVDGGSASASEIVAGALQDYKRAVIVGVRTFGKASVQTVINLSDGSGLLLTTNKYLTPKGRMIHKKGITPDVIVKFDMKSKKDNQLEKAQQVIKQLMSGQGVDQIIKDAKQKAKVAKP